MLTALQQRVLRLVATLPEASDFALAGGGALVARGAVNRTTRDLDLFAPGADAIKRLLDPLEKALLAEGLQVRRIRVADTFARLAVDDGLEQTEIDLAQDVRLMAPEVTDLGTILAAEELAIDKLLALFDRAEARDFVDFAAVVDDWGLGYLCERAVGKDAGFDRNMLAEQLGRFDRLPDREFPIVADELPRLRETVEKWRHALSSDS